MNRAAVILAGGAGTRLWPLSTDQRPKQFLEIFHGESLLQKTWKRLSAMFRSDRIFVSTQEAYRPLCHQQLPELKAENVIAEPSRRNTGPAITLTCARIHERIGPAVIAIFPSDHFIGDESGFAVAVRTACEFAERNAHLVTIALTPTEPHTGFGYMQLGEELAPGIHAVARFVEKPDRERAEEFVRSGEYAWNGGMFIWQSAVFLSEIARAAPEIAAVTAANYESRPAISIDYALLERADKVAAVRADVGWSDVGSWKAVAELSADANADTQRGEGVSVFGTTGRPVVVIGVSNVVVAESEEGVLVLDPARSQELTEVVRELEKKKG